MKRQVYVIEGRRKGELRESKWHIFEATDIRTTAYLHLRNCRERSKHYPSRYVFRITTYVPKGSK